MSDSEQEIEFNKEEILRVEEEELKNAQNGKKLFEIILLLILIVMFSSLCGYAWKDGAFKEWFGKKVDQTLTDEGTDMYAGALLPYKPKLTWYTNGINMIWYSNSITMTTNKWYNPIGILTQFRGGTGIVYSNNLFIDECYITNDSRLTDTDIILPRKH